MATRLLVTSAGTGPSNNLIRSLRAASFFGTKLDLQHRR